MPTVLRVEGYRFYFYANDSKEPPHIHVQYAGQTAKFWLNPVLLSNNWGMNIKELSKASRLVSKNESFFREKWHAFFSKKN